MSGGYQTVPWSGKCCGGSVGSGGVERSWGCSGKQLGCDVTSRNGGGEERRLSGGVVVRGEKWELCRYFSD